MNTDDDGQPLPPKLKMYTYLTLNIYTLFGELMLQASVVAQ
jgi:hypothetical protein